ncbi:MAG: CHAT domain-containing protein [Streptosporangiaceae bacterium]
MLDDKVVYFGGYLADFQRAVEVLETVVAESPADDPERPEYQAQLAMALHQVAEATGDIELTNRAAGLATGVLDATPPTSPRWQGYARDLAVILSGRAKKTRNRGDVDEAIRLLDQIDMTSLDTADSYVPRLSLGNALLLRFQLGGAAGDLDRAVKLMEEAVSCTSPMTPRWLVARRNLAAVLQARHSVAGKPEDLERLSSLQQERGRTAVPAIRHADDFQNLFEQYEATSDLTVLDAAIAGLDRELAAPPSGSPAHYNGLLNMGVLLWRKYEHTGDINLLGQAILIYEGLLAECPAGSVTRARAQGKRGLCLRDRYVRTADGADLDRAIADYREVLGSPGLPHPLRHEVYGNLGLALWDRYGATGSLRDLDDAVAAIQTRVTIPGFRRHDDTALNTLGLALRDRYQHSGDPQDLAGAVLAHEQAVALSLPASPRHGSLLDSLGGTYFYRWFHARDPADLDRAVLAFDEASAVGEPGQADRLRSLANLATSLQHRYIELRTPADLDRAIAMAEAAISESPAGTAQSNLYLYNLAEAVRTRYDQAGRKPDLRRAIRAYRDCCAHAQDSRPATAFGAAGSWCGWASRRGAWCEAAEAGELAVSAMVRLFQNQYGRPHKEAWLAASSGVPALAAYALAMAGEPARAAVALESGRALLLSEALRQDRAGLDALQALGHGDLAGRYLEASERWTRLLAMAGQPPDSVPQPSGTASLLLPGSTAGASAETSRFMSSWQHGEQLKAARAALDAAIEAIRGIPGHKRFLQSPGIEDIRAAAASPLVYLVAAEHGGMALIVRAPASGNHDQEGTHVVRLPELTTGQVGGWTRTLREAHGHRDDQLTWRGALDAVTARLWTAAMGPVIEALDGAETAVLIPAGQLVMLPLHAAWTTDTTLPGGRRYAVDEACLSYAPNAASLGAAAAIAVSAAADSLLLVEEPRPSTRGPLPFARAEAAAVAAPFTHIKALRHENATVSAVLGALDGRNVQHFTCHALADLASPLDSALILADDGPLTLREILEQHPGRPGRAGLRLAVLAACETQVPGRQLPDEVISLPAGLIQAGAAGVIASQWAVPGLATAMLMTRFYQYWKHDQLTPAAALRSAQRWLRDSTNGEKADYFKAAMTDAPGPATDSARTLWRAMIRKTPGDPMPRG